MGKIVFANVHPQLLEKITAFCAGKGVGKDFIEDLSAGLNHAEIGGMIAEKWNFPGSLIEAIRFHHEPVDCSAEYSDVVYTVYLANALCNMEDGQIAYEQLNEEVLKSFGITSEQQLKLIGEKLSQAFKADREKM
jgi:HD-like signal output (HDOD) protein